LLPTDTTGAAFTHLQINGSSKVGSLSATTVQRMVLNLFLSRTLSAENTITFSDARLSYDDGLNQDGGAARASGTLELRELLGGFRLNSWSTNDDALQFYARGGYGYTWYKLTDVSLDGRFVDYEHKGGYPPSIWPSKYWWPNTWYLGAGVEVFTPPKVLDPEPYWRGRARRPDHELALTGCAQTRCAESWLGAPRRHSRIIAPRLVRDTGTCTWHVYVHVYVYGWALRMLASAAAMVLASCPIRLQIHRTRERERTRATYTSPVSS
jgi:hypothetical protein